MNFPWQFKKKTWSVWASTECQISTSYDFKLIKLRSKNDGIFVGEYFWPNAVRYRLRNFPSVNWWRTIAETHLDIHPDYQWKWLAGEMVKAFILKKWYPVWFSHGRITNPNVYKVIDKIGTDDNFILDKSNELWILITLKQNH